MLYKVLSIVAIVLLTVSVQAENSKKKDRPVGKAIEIFSDDVFDLEGNKSKKPTKSKSSRGTERDIDYTQFPENSANRQRRRATCAKFQNNPEQYRNCDRAEKAKLQRKLQSQRDRVERKQGQKLQNMKGYGMDGALSPNPTDEK